MNSYTVYINLINLMKGVFQMKNQMLKKKSTGSSNAVKKFKRLMLSWSFALMTTVILPITAFAADNNNNQQSTSQSTSDASVDKWNKIINLIVPWIGRLGGVVALVGAVLWGLGFKSEDAEQQTRGLRTIISGMIVIAVGVGADIFLA